MQSVSAKFKNNRARNAEKKRKLITMITQNRCKCSGFVLLITQNITEMKELLR